MVGGPVVAGSVDEVDGGGLEVVVVVPTLVDVVAVLGGGSLLQPVRTAPTIRTVPALIANRLMFTAIICSLALSNVGTELHSRYIKEGLRN